MAVYRLIHVSFWQDAFVLDLTPEEKYFYIYLMTNSKTSQCGIYELPKRIIETETGYNRETVDKLLQRFIDYGKILYSNETKEIMLLNWLKHNSLNSPKVQSCVKKELENVKNKEFVRIFYTLCIQYGYPIDTLSIDYGEKEKEKDKKNNNTDADTDDPINRIIDTYLNIRGMSSDLFLSGTDRGYAQALVESGIPTDFIIRAMMELSTKKKVNSMRYFYEAIPDIWDKSQKHDHQRERNEETKTPNEFSPEFLATYGF